MLQDGRILAPLDVTAFDERVYRELLAGPEATARELAARLGADRIGWRGRWTGCAPVVW
jgi:hypothetical protein